MMRMTNTFSVFINNLHQRLDQLHLLKHPFYQAWNQGKLSISDLQTYALEYYHHVSFFPRYLSQIHSLCSDIKDRQVLLENLNDEEQGEENHPELWIRFIEGLGLSRDQIKSRPELDNTNRLVDSYFDLVRTDYPTGLGTLYAYERQTPDVSKSKIEGLKKHYNVSDKKSLQFFEVHQEADEWHTEEIRSLLDKLSVEDQKKAEAGAVKGSELLWHFLDGIVNHCNIACS